MTVLHMQYVATALALDARGHPVELRVHCTSPLTDRDRPNAGVPLEAGSELSPPYFAGNNYVVLTLIWFIKVHLRSML